MTPIGHIVVLITAGSKEEADRLARGLVEEKLAFCVNTVPGVQSTYFWEGRIHTDPEFLLVVKTRSGRFTALRDWVVANHSYDVPEIISLPIMDGLDAYLEGIDAWVPGS